MEFLRIILITAAAISYPLSIFIDVSVYNLRFLLIGKKGVKYWLSQLTVYQYIARFFMLIFIPITAYITESFQSLETTSAILITAHFGVIIILGLSINFFKSTSKLCLFFVQKLNFNKNTNSLSDAFLLPIGLIESFNLLKPDSIKLFLSSLISQFLISISMTVIFILNFIYRDSILFFNSLTQGLNMFASIILFLYIDPKVMQSFDREYGGQNNLKIIYYSRMIAHLISLLFFLVLYFNLK